MLGIKTEFHKFPKPDSSISTLELLSDYLDEIKDFFVNKLKFYYKERQTYVQNTNDIAYIDYYSYEENKNPIFCIFNYPKKKDMLFLTPCGFNAGDYVPLGGYSKIPNTYLGNLYGLMGASSIIPWSIAFSIINLISTTTKVDLVVQDSKFTDGRRAIFFKPQEQDSGINTQVSTIMGLFYTDIVYKDINYLRDWIVMGGTFNSSYNVEIQDYLTSLNNLNQIVGPDGLKYTRKMGLGLITSLEHIGGIIPGLGQGKDYLIKQNLYIGEEAYIPSVYRYSNLIGAETNKGVAGNIVTIKGINYLILYNNYTQYDDGNDNYTYDNKIKLQGYYPIENSYRPYNSKIINESLIVPI